MTFWKPVLFAFIAAMPFHGSGLSAWGKAPVSAVLGSAPIGQQERFEALADPSGQQSKIAQNYARPPANLGAGEDRLDEPPQQNSASLLVRIDRLESQIRQLNGQIEQMQFANRRLEDQLKKFQADVDFRFQESSGRPANAGTPNNGTPPRVLQKRSETTPGDYVSGNETARNAEDLEENGTDLSPGAMQEWRSRRHDAFNPSIEPRAVGAPHALGDYTAAVPQSLDPLDDTESNAPLDLAGGKLAPKPNQRAVAVPSVGSKTATTAQPSGIGKTNMASNQTPGAAAALPANPATDEFANALNFFKQKEYEDAEKGFASFLQKNPQSRLNPDALYYLGESFYQRGRQREAAEQYLKISTHYANSARASQAMLRLGESLAALGAHEQACATFNEIPHKYPNAAPYIKAGAEREAKRAQC